MNPNQEQISGLIRTILVAATGYATGKGYISAGMANELVGFGVTVGLAAWSLWAHTRDSQLAAVTAKQDDVVVRQAMINAVAANPAVAKIVTTEQIARETPSSKVVTS